MCMMVETILRYGQYLTDSNIQDSNENYIRIRNIEYDGKIYYLEMVNGEVKNFQRIGKRS